MTIEIGTRVRLNPQHQQTGLVVRTATTRKGWKVIQWDDGVIDTWDETKLEPVPADPEPRPKLVMFKDLPNRTAFFHCGTCWMKWQNDAIVLKADVGNLAGIRIEQFELVLPLTHTHEFDPETLAVVTKLGLKE